MKRRGSTVAMTVLLGSGCVAARTDGTAPEPAPPGARIVTVHDRFDRAELDPAWDVAFTNPGSTAANTSGWTRGTSTAGLVVTAIEPATISGGWSYVSVSRSLGGHATDFSLSLSMAWKSARVTDMSNLFLTVYADDGSVLGQLVYHDAWTGSRAQWAAIPCYPLNGFWPATKAPGYAAYESGPGSLGACGAETLTIARNAGLMSLRVGAKEVLSYRAEGTAARVEVAFGYAYDPQSTMAEFRLNELSGTASLVSEAAAARGVAPAAEVVAPAASPSAPEPPPAADAIEQRWFERVDGTFEKEERLDIDAATPGVLFFRYGPISDSGVELERTAGGEVLWRVHVQPLGICHSKYHHEVKVRIDGERIVVDSIGAQHIVEVRELASGKQVSREVTDVQR